jgi:CheY-like chemotaxis protein
MVQAKHLIEELHGKSQLAATPGLSTTLKFIIKCQWKGMQVQKDTGRNSHVLENKKVLVVEDNEMNQQAIIHLLHSQGMSCTVAENGCEAIGMLEKHDDFDLVLLDMSIPRMDGCQTANYIRKKLKTAIPVIGMNTGQDKAEMLRCREAGIDRMISKPFMADDLVQLMSSFFPLAVLLAQVADRA